MAAEKVGEAIEALQFKVEVDTDVTTGHVDLLERLTHNSTVKYANINEALAPTASASEDVIASRREIETAVARLDAIEQYAAHVTALLSELEEWVGELDVKSRRMVQSR